MVFENGVRNIQAAAYNGERRVYNLVSVTHIFMNRHVLLVYHNFDLNSSMDLITSKTNLKRCLN